MLVELSVASTKPETAIARGAGWQPTQGRAWALAQRDSGREKGGHCRERHYALRTIFTGVDCASALITSSSMFMRYGRVTANTTHSATSSGMRGSTFA